MVSLEWLSFLYGMAGLIYICIVVADVIKEKGVRIIHCVEIMYAFVYGLLPMIIFFKESQGERNLIYHNYTNEGILTLYFNFLISVVAFVLLIFFYKVVYKKNKENSFQTLHLNDEKQKNDKHVFICGCICLLIGWVGLYLWTRAYGSISNFIMEAAMIRSGLGSVDNPLAFMKQFARIIPISLYALLASYLVRRPKGLARIGYLVLLVVSGLGTWVYILSADSRTQIGLAVIAVILVTLRHRKRENIKGRLLIVAFLAVFAFFVTMYADSITYFARYGVWKNPETGIIDGLITEFKYIPSTQMKVMEILQTGELPNKLWDDFLLSITSWVPERFVPFSLPQSVWAYNTVLLAGSNAGGTLPSDLITTGVYHFGVIGIVIYPAIFGACIGYIDKKIVRGGSFYMDPYYAGFASIFINAVSHNQLSSMVGAMFPLFAYFIVSFAVKLVYKNRMKSVRDE